MVGHSLGGMIATRLAVLAPERVASLTLVCATAGGWQSLPCSWRVAKYGLQVRRQPGWVGGWQLGGACVCCPGLAAIHCCCSLTFVHAAQMLFARTAEDRAKIDLKLHFMRKTLNEVVRFYDVFRTCLLQQACVYGQLLVQKTLSLSSFLSEDVLVGPEAWAHTAGAAPGGVRGGSPAWRHWPAVHRVPGGRLSFWAPSCLHSKDMAMSLK